MEAMGVVIALVWCLVVGGFIVWLRWDRKKRLEPFSYMAPEQTVEKLPESAEEAPTCCDLIIAVLRKYGSGTARSVRRRILAEGNTYTWGVRMVSLRLVQLAREGQVSRLKRGGRRGRLDVFYSPA